MSLVKKRVTHKLLAAMQNNGRKSLGPGMESGKSHSSLNAIQAVMESGKSHSSLNAIQAVKEKFKEESLSLASERLKQEQSEVQQRVQEAIDKAEQKPERGRSLPLDVLNRIREIYGLPPLAPQSESAVGQAPPDAAI